MDIGSLLQQVEAYTSPQERDAISLAFQYAQKYHGQFQRGNILYIQHVLETASILANVQANPDTIVVGLLHGCANIPGVSWKELEASFGSEIISLIQAVGKLSKIYYRVGMSDTQIELLRKVATSLAFDMRILMVRLASRISHMKSVYVYTTEYKRMAHENIEIYCFLAEAFGMWHLKQQLEDLSFRILFPDKYQEIALRVEGRKKDAEKYMNQVKKIILNHMQSLNIPLRIMSRFKHIYSIFQKMEQKKKNFDDIHDIFALRIIVHDLVDCYRVLYMLHMIFNPIHGTIKDYIGSPKPNGYRSLHTTVYGLNGYINEFQICTQEMYEESLYGVPAHAYYKLNAKKATPDPWMKKLFSLQKQKGSLASGHFQSSLMNDTVFAFTRKGDVIELPKGSTVLDFSYAVHTSLGHRCVGAMVNNIECSIDTIIQNGDTIRILYTEYDQPREKWLAFVKTKTAQRAIHQWLKKYRMHEQARIGYTFLERDIKRYLNSSLSDVNIQKIILNAYQRYRSLEDVCMDISEKKISSKEILQTCFSKEELTFSQEKIALNTLQNTKTSYNTFIIRGRDDIRVMQDIFEIMCENGWEAVEIKKRLEITINRFALFITVNMKDFSHIYDFCSAIDSISGVESILKS